VSAADDLDDLDDDLDLFMVCPALDRSALTALPAGYHFRHCRADEVTTWMDMQFDDEADAVAYRPFMVSWFDRVYGQRGASFLERCTFACDGSDHPVATAFTFVTSQGITTFHWLKVRRSHEGMGLGRAIAGRVMDELAPTSYPVLLHTHPTSQRALKLYSDLGFDLVVDAHVGSRSNDLDAALPYLERTMTPSAFSALRFARAPDAVLAALATETEPEF
jgi:GNAT superfamily N-acetyltransferase